MTFQAYLDTIQRNTGKKPEDFRALAEHKRLLDAPVTATQFTDWLKRDFGLGHGHAMALLAVFKTKKWITLTPARAKRKGT
jgi:Domain of unknown function (DUF4287)